MVAASRSDGRRAFAAAIAVHVVLFAGLWLWNRPLPDPERRSETGLAHAAMTESRPHSVPAFPPSRPADVDPTQVVASVEAQVAEAERLSDERKLSELEKNLDRLQRVATPESVRSVNEVIAGSLGLDTETYQPKTTTREGTFDPSTAQLTDVLRSRDSEGKWQYQSVMVDAEGHSQTVPLAGPEGETAYRTFQQLKEFPMAEGIYRSVVMPMMQQMMEAGDAVNRAARVAEQMQVEDDVVAESETLPDD